MRKKLIGILLILLAALVIVQDYFIKWEISIWMLAWVVLLAILSLSSLVFSLYYSIINKETIKQEKRG